jgi:hypothetical protein
MNVKGSSPTLPVPVLRALRKLGQDIRDGRRLATNTCGYTCGADINHPRDAAQD